MRDAMTRDPTTLLQRLIQERHLTHREVLRVLHQRARQMGVADFDLSQRSLARWLAGGLKHRPHPASCRVVEAEFGHRIEALLAPPAAPPPPATVDQAAAVDLPTMVFEAARSSARFGQWADSLGVGALTIETIQLRLRQLAVDYVHASMVPVFRELTALRDDLVALLAAPDPAQARELYLCTGVCCAMLAHASGNLGFLAEAGLQAQTALICARRADHSMLAAWALGVRALQCEWNGRPQESLALLERAGAAAARRPGGGSITVWLPAIEARALARLGRRGDAMEAVTRVTDNRGRVTSLGPDSLDRIGGILEFPYAKEQFYLATAYRRIGRLDRAADHAGAAIDAYVTGPAVQRSYGDEALARIELSIARAAGTHPDLDGALEQLEFIRALPRQRLLPALAEPLRDLRAAVTGPALGPTAPAREIHRTTAELIDVCRRPLAELTG
jgi:tetratricopeptide (TPR) repeat protein